MAQTALYPGTIPPRRRALFGLLDANSWTWAFLKALVWFLLLIFFLGYVPDRAYYFTVNRTIDLGILAWSPVNFCPGGNQSLPCPAPVGAVVPWAPSPQEISLPAPRTDGAVVQSGTSLLFVGGSDGKAPVAQCKVRASQVQRGVRTTALESFAGVLERHLAHYVALEWSC